MITLACLFKGKSSAWVQGVKDRLKAGKSYLRQTSRSAFLKKASVLITAGYLRCLTLKIISKSMNTRNHVKDATISRMFLREIELKRDLQETFTSGKRLLIPRSTVFPFQNQKPKLSCSQNQRKKTDFSPNRIYIVQFIVNRFILHM